MTPEMEFDLRAAIVRAHFFYQQPFLAPMSIGNTTWLPHAPCRDCPVCRMAATNNPTATELRDFLFGQPASLPIPSKSEAKPVQLALFDSLQLAA